MPAAGNKRPLPPKIAAMQAKKRQRLNGDAPKEAPKNSKAKSKARLDSLKWKSVEMPDRLDDYEGFFGLEEIDDVDVHRDESGIVSYMAEESNRGKPNEGADESDGDDGADAEEWDGFGDDDKPSEEPAKKKAKKEKKKKEPKQKGKKDEAKAKPTNAKSTNGEQSADASFSALMNENGDESSVSVDAWKPLKLSPDTMASLAKLKFGKPTPIQKAAIPEILGGHDVVGKASTGSGKTLAFGIPILERYLETLNSPKKSKGDDTQKSPIAFIMSPTRELAHQLEKHIGALCSAGNFRAPLIATLTGGLSVQKQERLLKTADIVIGTPGRLWEVMSTGHGTIAPLKKIQFLVIDEADRLLSEGHFKEVEEILNALETEDDSDNDGEEESDSKDQPKPHRQTLVFSATFDRGLQRKLAGKVKAGGDLMNNKESLEYLLSKVKFHEETPKFVDVNPVSQMATGLKEGMVECAGTEKDLFLYSLLLLHPNTRTLVFTNSISAVRRITPLLQNLQLPVMALHSGMAQKARLRSVERFTEASPQQKQASILIATDVAARGLDIKNVQLVIHYHLPRAADTYVHRSGRTARAGQSGSSILICGPEEVGGVRRLIAKVHAQSAVTHDQSASEAAKQGFFIRTLDIDRRIVSRVKPRLTLAKKLADVVIAKEKAHKEDDFMRAAAEELGVDYDSEEFEKEARGKTGRGGGRKKKERESRAHTKDEVAAMKGELKDLLRQRVNVGVSEKYLTSGNVDVDELLRQQESAGGVTGDFLGTVSGLEM